MKPRICVIVPVLNREKLIERCLNSIISQSVKPDEIIIVDNGSTDYTVPIIEKWIENNQKDNLTITLLQEKKKGACFARQKGLENTEMEYVSFFDSDDEMHPNLIETACKEITHDTTLDIVCWKCRIHQLNGGEKIPAFLSGDPLESHLIHTLLRPQGYIVKRSFLLDAGGWKKPVSVWNDYELGFRLLLNNPKIKAIKEILAEIYSQENSITGKDFSSKEGLWEQTLQEMEKVNDEKSHVSQKKVRKILNYRKVILGAHYFREGNKAGAKKLIMETFNKVSFKDKILYTFAYLHTRNGYRGAWRVIRKFL